MWVKSVALPIITAGFTDCSFLPSTSLSIYLHPQTSSSLHQFLGGRTTIVSIEQRQKPGQRGYGTCLGSFSW